MEMRCLPLSAWVEKFHTKPFSICDYSIRENEAGDLCVYGRNRDIHSISMSKRDEVAICTVPDNLMIVTVPYIAGGKASDNLRSGTYIGDIPDMMQLQTMIENITEELSLAIEVVNDFLRT
jgi:hypothetical protein